MSKRLELKISKELYDELEISRIKLNLEDRQDVVRLVLEKRFLKGFFNWLKKLFRF